MSQLQTFPLAGMSCTSCVSKVAERLKAHPVIREAVVTLHPPEVKLSVDDPLSSETLNEWLAPMGKYRVPTDAPALPPKSATTYRPLFILLAYLILVIGAEAVHAGAFSLSSAMRWFMGGFFIAFSFFKMLDLRGFRDAYQSYDLIAKAWPNFGLVYPFLELGLGLAYLADWQPFAVNLFTAVLMTVSLAGVIKAVTSRQTIRCACLGTVFNLPMSTVTIIEDGVMVVMAISSLFLAH